MRLFSYRNRTKFRKIGITLLIIILFVTALVLGVLAYLGRYIVYDQDGAHLDFDLDTAEPAPTVVTPTVDAVISYVSPDDEAAIGTTRKVTGYYVTTEMLQDLDAVRSTLDSDNYYAVLFDLKDSFGYYYLTHLPLAAPRPPLPWTTRPLRADRRSLPGRRLPHRPYPRLCRPTLLPEPHRLGPSPFQWRALGRWERLLLDGSGGRFRHQLSGNHLHGAASHGIP